MNVEEMGFSTRTQNALKRNGIHRMEQLQGLGLSELLSLRGIGVRAAAGIQRKGSAVPRKPTKQELSQFLALKKEAESYQKRLRELEKDTASDPVEMEKIREKCREARMRCLKEIQWLEDFLQTIPDSRLRLIFAKRYLEGKSWQAVAFAIGHYDEQYPRKLHNRYLNT